VTTPHRREHPVLAIVPFAIVLLVVAGGLLRIVQYYWREGTVLIGVAMMLAALLRGLLSTDHVGLLAIRGRGVDVLTYAGFGLAIIAVALTIEGGPWGS